VCGCESEAVCTGGFFTPSCGCYPIGSSSYVSFDFPNNLTSADIEKAESFIDFMNAKGFTDLVIASKRVLNNVKDNNVTDYSDSENNFVNVFELLPESDQELLINWVLNN